MATPHWTCLIRVLGTLVLAGCSARGPVMLRASSLAVPVSLSGDFSGSVSLDGDVLTVQLAEAEVRFSARAQGDSVLLDGVTVRAVIAADSAGVGIPLGASGAIAVADVMQPGERRVLGAQSFALPLPPGARLRDLWLAFQLRGTSRAAGRAPELVIAYACSETNVLGDTKSATRRARRMRANYVSGCRL